MKLPKIAPGIAPALVFCVSLCGIFAPKASGATADPTFVDRYDYGACYSGYDDLATADINGDGIPDLICGNISSVLTLLGNGDGTFRPGPSSSIGFYVSNGLVAEDVNGDGKTDLIAASTIGFSSTSGIAVSFGNGDGTFQPASFYQTGTATSVLFLVTGDFNRDGFTDVEAQSDQGIWFFAGKGEGLFQPGVLTPVSGSTGYPHPLATADVNGDGKLDIVLGNYVGLATLLGNGDGTFQPEIDTVVSILDNAFAVEDLNGDGRPDVLIVGSYYSDGLLYLGNGDGTFTLNKQIYLASEPSSVAIADVNGDGFPDIISGGSDILFGNGKGQFSQPVYYPISSYGDAPYLITADLRNNGRTDLVFLNYYGGLSVLLNEGNGKFEDGESIPVSGGGAYCAVSADFNGDGKPDLAASGGPGAPSYCAAPGSTPSDVLFCQLVAAAYSSPGVFSTELAKPLTGTGQDGTTLLSTAAECQQSSYVNYVASLYGQGACNVPPVCQG